MIMLKIIIERIMVTICGVGDEEIQDFLTYSIHFPLGTATRRQSCLDKVGVR
jgi:hypothetical protein